MKTAPDYSTDYFELDYYNFPADDIDYLSDMDAT